MPNRILKESIRTNRKVNSISDFQFRVWTYLITYVDDYGRGSADPEILKGFLLPRRKGVTEKAISDALAELANMGLINLYSVDGEPYLCFPTWGEHQRMQTKRSKFPEPSENELFQNSTVIHGDSRYVTVTHGDSPLESNPNPNTNSNPNPNTNCASARERELTAEFETLWKSYPKKQGKDAALKAYIKAREAGTTLAEVEAGLKSYVEYLKVCQTEEKYMKHGSTWFNQHCWNDTYVPTTPTLGKKDIPKGASGELGQAELEAIQNLLAEGNQAESNPLPF